MVREFYFSNQESENRKNQETENHESENELSDIQQLKI